MWYVINKQNGQKLVKFKKNVILPLFEYILLYKRNNESISFAAFLDKIICENQKQLKAYDKVLKKYEIKNIKEKRERSEKKVENAKVLKYICKRHVKKILFINCIDYLLFNYTESQLKMHICVYYIQNKELKNRTDFIKERDIPNEWHIIFKNFFYEKFFSMDQIWQRIDDNIYTREIFHENFKEDNNIWVCPYCDSSEITSNGNLEVEHFWPESIYPFLSMAPLNLYSSCKACNNPATGKGIITKNPIILPFYKQIGNEVSFKPDIVKHKINIKGKTVAINNYIHLIKLEERYSKKSGYTIVKNLTSSIYATIKELESHKHVVSDEDIEKYVSLRIMPKTQPHFFVTKDILKDYNRYLEFLNR